MESASVILNGLGAVRLARDVRGWPVLVAGAILIIVIAAQLSVALWRSLADARGALAEQRRKSEQQAVEELTRKARTGKDMTGSPYRTRSILSRMSYVADRISGAAAPWKLRELAREEKSALGPARRVIERFGLEPTWAFRQLDENLGVPAARELTRRLQLADARWAGRMTAFVLSSLFFLGVYFSTLALPALSVSFTTYVILVVLLLVFAAGQLIATRAATRAVYDLNAKQLYLHIGDLLELHRFELYRALAVPLPRDSKQERKGKISAWRLGSGSVTFDEGDALDDKGDVRQQVAALTDLFRGPELVSYDGYVSWQVSEDKVELAFSRMPVLGDGHAHLQVAGSRDAPDAPFDITADSAAVTLVQVRGSVRAPVDGSTARTTFDFQRRPDADPEIPELWFEISQLGRFVQLLRVPAAWPSARRRE